MKDIFLSYKKEDADRVRILVRAFEREGFSVWWDRTIPPGSSWAKVIEEAIEGCRVVVVVWSELSVGSEWVQKEARKGEGRGILVPSGDRPRGDSRSSSSTCRARASSGGTGAPTTTSSGSSWLRCASGSILPLRSSKDPTRTRSSARVDGPRPGDL